MGSQFGKLECTADSLHPKQSQRNYRSKRGKWSSETNQKARDNSGKMKA